MSRFNFIDVDPPVGPDPVSPPSDWDQYRLRGLHAQGEKAVLYNWRITLTPLVLTELFMPVRARVTRVVRVWMNALEYSDLSQFSRDLLKVETDASKRALGIMGTIWGVELRVSSKIPISFIQVVGRDEGTSDLHPDWVPDVDKLAVVRYLGKLPRERV